MRVLFLAHAYPRFEGDPVGSFILRLAVALREQDVSVTVLAPGAPGVAAHDVIEGIPTHRFRYAPRRFENLAYTGTMGQQVLESWTARAALAGLLGAWSAHALRLVRHECIDLIHAHWWFPGGVVGAAVGAVTRRPLVITMHGSDVRLLESQPLARRMFGLVARRSATMTAVSSWLANSAARMDARAKPVVAPMPVISGLFAPGDSRATDRLLFVGKLAPQKGLHHLLKAMARLRSTPTLDVVGAGRVDDAEVRQLALDLGLGERVRWFPLLSQQELALRYREASILVIPAINEGLGLTAVEALLSETPVVAFESGGIPDVVIHDRTGLLVQPGDEAGLAEAIDRLLGDAALRTRLGRQGREHVMATFGTDAAANRYARIYAAALRPSDE